MILDVIEIGWALIIGAQAWPFGLSFVLCVLAISIMLGGGAHGGV